MPDDPDQYIPPWKLPSESVEPVASQMHTQEDQSTQNSSGEVPKKPPKATLYIKAFLSIILLLSLFYAFSLVALDIQPGASVTVGVYSIVVVVLISIIWIKLPWKEILLVSILAIIITAGVILAGYLIGPTGDLRVGWTQDGKFDLPVIKAGFPFRADLPTSFDKETLDLYLQVDSINLDIVTLLADLVANFVLSYTLWFIVKKLVFRR